MTILGQGDLSRQVSDGMSTVASRFWFVLWRDVVVAPQREGMLENPWVWREGPEISGFCCFSGLEGEEGQLVA